MAYAYVPLTTWFTGVLNGHRQKEQGLPRSIVWSVLGTSSVLSMIKILSATPPASITLQTVKPLSVATFVVTPLYMGATFFLGDQIGQAIRYVEDQKKGVKITLI